MKNQKYLLLVLLAIVVAILYSTSGRKEGFFSSCYRYSTIYLKNVDGGKNGGFVKVEQYQGKTFLSMKAYLPLAEAGVFTTLDGHYYISSFFWLCT